VNYQAIHASETMPTCTVAPYLAEIEHCYCAFSNGKNTFSYLEGTSQNDQEANLTSQRIRVFFFARNAVVDVECNALNGLKKGFGRCIRERPTAGH